MYGNQETSRFQDAPRTQGMHVNQGATDANNGLTDANNGLTDANNGLTDATHVATYGTQEGLDSYRKNSQENESENKVYNTADLYDDDDNYNLPKQNNMDKSTNQYTPSKKIASTPVPVQHSDNDNISSLTQSPVQQQANTSNVPSDVINSFENIMDYLSDKVSNSVVQKMSGMSTYEGQGLQNGYRATNLAARSAAMGGKRIRTFKHNRKVSKNITKSKPYVF